MLRDYRGQAKTLGKIELWDVHYGVHVFVISFRNFRNFRLFKVSNKQNVYIINMSK